jgi:hypothetical protein
MIVVVHAHDEVRIAEEMVSVVAKN